MMSESSNDEPKPDDAKADTEKRSGRVAFDSRGNSVWEWQVKTGVYSRDVNTESVRKLDLDELSLMDTAALRSMEDKEDTEPTSAPQLGQPKPATLSRIDPKLAGGGFNPYDNAASINHRRGEGRDPYDNARLRSEALMKSRDAANSAPARSQTPARKAAAAKPVPTDVRKLSGWLKLKRALFGKRTQD
jgi:hypothetical protein